MKPSFSSLFSIQFNSIFFLLLIISGNYYLSAQSGGWDSNSQNGTTGYTDYGNGVIQLLNTTNTGCSASAIHESTSTYDPTSGSTFSKCYQVFFGCPGNDQIGSDSKGDGMAFSFSKCAYNINNGLACGGGLGYMGSCSQMITIEFDTWSSAGTSNFDNIYQGTGNQDQIAFHKNGDASFTGYVTGSNPGNLEDGLEHTVCISYDPATDIYAVTIDGANVFTYDATGTGNELEIYFGAGGLNQTWSSGKAGATNPTTVSNGFDITDQIGSPLCPSGVEITSPSTGTIYSDCPQGPITITATATAPAGNTVNYVEFLVDGISIGTDNTANYSLIWNSPTNGNHTLTATAYYIPSGTNSTSSSISVGIGGGIQSTSTAPTINGTAEALWSSYLSYDMDQGSVSAPDLDGSFRVMYDATYLYFFATITDETLLNDSGNDWEDDGIELFIDIGNDKSTSYGANDYQFGFMYGGTFAEYKHSSIAGINYAQGTIAGGYTVEARIPWTSLSLGSAPAAGTNIGFDVKLNDDDDGGTRDSELSFKDGTFGQWNNPSLFGTLQVTSCNPLPICMTSCYGSLIKGNTILDWITSSENQNKKFVIQHTTSLTEWTAIGEIQGAGSTQATHYYSFIDYNVAIGKNYYRLVSQDQNGNSSFSDVITVDKFNGNIGISPNPFNDQVTLYSGQNGTHEITITNALGNIVYNEEIEIVNGQHHLNLLLPNGIYFLQLKNSHSVDLIEIVKE